MGGRVSYRAEEDNGIERERNLHPAGHLYPSAPPAPPEPSEPFFPLLPPIFVLPAFAFAFTFPFPASPPHPPPPPSPEAEAPPDPSPPYPKRTPRTHIASSQPSGYASLSTNERYDVSAFARAEVRREVIELMSGCAAAVAAVVVVVVVLLLLWLGPRGKEDNDSGGTKACPVVVPLVPAEETLAASDEEMCDFRHSPVPAAGPAAAAGPCRRRDDHPPAPTSAPPPRPRPALDPATDLSFSFSLSSS